VKSGPGEVGLQIRAVIGREGDSTGGASRMDWPVSRSIRRTPRASLYGPPGASATRKVVIHPEIQRSGPQSQSIWKSAPCVGVCSRQAGEERKGATGPVGPAAAGCPSPASGQRIS